MRYIYPCKPNTLPSEVLLRGEYDTLKWVTEKKMNGWRCMPSKENGRIVLWNRHGGLIEYPELEPIRQALDILPNETRLDGELVFNRRIKNAEPILYLFDIIYHKGKLIADTKMVNRWIALVSVLGNLVDSHVRLIEYFPNDMPKYEAFQRAIQSPDTEGIVLKKMDSPYTWGVSSCLRNPFWLKVKEVVK